MSDETLLQSVLNASRRPEVAEAVGRVYAQLQEATEARRPVCSASGRCCRFDEYGHRLYVTTMELAAFLAELPAVSCQLPVKTRSLPLLASSPGCPFQVDKLCTVHAIRPFGCRMFFCDPTATVWQNEQYEHFHAQLQRLHGELGVPYFYVEWREGLRQLGLGEPLSVAAVQL